MPLLQVELTTISFILAPGLTDGWDKLLPTDVYLADTLSVAQASKNTPIYVETILPVFKQQEIIGDRPGSQSNHSEQFVMYFAQAKGLELLGMDPMVTVC